MAPAVPSDKRGGRWGLLGQLWFQVLVGMVGGVAVGHLWPTIGVDLKPLGDAFIALVKMIIAPVVFCTVVHGVAAVGDMKRVGRVALKALIWFELITTIALVFGLVAVNLTQPGRGMNIDAATIDASAVSNYAAQAKAQSVGEYLLHIIPDTFLGAFTGGSILQVLLVSLLFAFALTRMGESGQPILDLVERVSGVFFRIVGFIMWVAPIGAFGSLAFTVGKFGVASLAPLLGLIAHFYVVCALFTVVVLGGAAWLAGVSLWRLIAHIRDELVVVAATTSSEAVLPRLIQKMKGVGCDESVVGLVIPTSYSFNLDGTCLYLATTAVFLAQATNTPLGVVEQLGLLAVLLLTSKGVAGVAGAAFIVLAATLSTTGTIPLASIALVLGIHRIMAEALTFVNVVGNCVATIVVARWEGAVDLDILRAKVGTGRRAALSTV
jgi:aerobic C4-dicarboxylate transport protein